MTGRFDIGDCGQSLLWQFYWQLAAGVGFFVRRDALRGTSMSNQVISGNFIFTDTSIEGMKIVEVKAYGDDRDYFMETYKRPDFIAGGIDCEFVQDNQSSSTRGVLRGLHFQIEHPQAKLVRVVSGKVFDAAVDLRKGSPTYGKWEGVVLSAENKRQFFIPHGFAHGFLVLSDTAEFCYKCDDVYHPVIKAISCGMIPLSSSRGQRSMATPSSIRPKSS